MNDMIIGCGSGRCGTMSLARLLDKQPSLNVTHERYKWRVSRHVEGEEYADRLLREKGGDVALYWLWHAEYILKRRPEARIICLKRGRVKTVESYLAKTPEHSPCEEWGEGNPWNRCYPTYRQAPSKRFALNAYWYHYYDRAKELAKKHPQFRVFITEALNSREGQWRILSHVGIAEDDMVFDVGIRENKLLAA